METIISSFITESKVWQTELLEAQRYTVQDDIQQFSNQLDSFVQSELESQFHRMISAKLYFDNMPDRHGSIAQAHEKTFNWLFRSDDTDTESPHWDSFTDWLQEANSNRVYWITGRYSHIRHLVFSMVPINLLT